MQFIILVRTDNSPRKQQLRPRLFIVEKETDKTWQVRDPKDNFNRVRRMYKDEHVWKLFEDVDEAAMFLHNMKSACKIYEVELAQEQLKGHIYTANAHVAEYIEGFEC